jgi:hypothetical protein
MSSTISFISILAKLAGVVALALGITFWTGHALRLTPLHMISGSVVVLCLWTLALLSFKQGARRGLSVLGVGWGFVVPVLGMAQYQLMPGDHHWVIRVAHLLVGVVAVMLVERIAEGMHAVNGASAEPA